MDIQKTLIKLQEAGLTQAQIAAAIDCSQPTVNEMLAGKTLRIQRAYKMVTAIRTLAEQFGISVKSSRKKL